MQPHLDIPGIELERSVGQGSASLVFRGRRRVAPAAGDGGDAEGPQLVAVKLFTPAPHVAAEALRQRVVREAALLASLNHPGLAKIYEVGEHAGRPYIVMEFIEGRSLASALAARGGPMPCPRVIAIGHAVAEVLDHVWRRGLVHRDLKPSNVLIDACGAVKLIDFGFAELWSRDPSGWGDSQARSRPVGTFTYSAPEQTGILRRPVDGRADLYALGALLYECATGRPPFVAEDVGSLLHMHAAVRPEDPRAHNPSIPSGLAAIIMRLLRKDPEERYQAAASLLADLARVEALTRQLDAFASARKGDAPAPAELVEERVDPPLGALSAPRGDDLSPLLRAREPELLGLLERWRGAMEGRGSFVVLTGPPGAGAHPLCAGLIERASASTRALVLRGRCDEELNLAFAPLVQALVGFMSDAAGGRSAIVARRGLIRTAAGDGRAALAKLSPRLAGLLGVATASAGTRDGHNAEQVFALDRVLRALSEVGGPVLLVLEDVQWLDEASREVVTALRRRLDGPSPPPLMLVCTTRQSTRRTVGARPLRDDQRPAELLLRPLALSAARRVIVDSLGGAPVDESIVRAVLARSGEQPETIVECVRTMLSSGVLRPSWGRWELDAARLPELGLPGDMAALVLHRLSDIEPDDREVLRWAAVVGPRFSLAHLPSIIERDADKVVRAFENANAVGVIERVHGDEYGFVHPSIRAALLGELTGAQRRACHLRIALTLDEVPTLTAAQLFARARHYAEALDRETARRAFETNRSAGALALRTHAPEHAYQFLAAALQARMIGGLGEDLDLYETLGDVCQRTYRYRQAEAHFRHLLERRERASARAKVCAKLASVHAAAPDVGAARAVVKRGLEELEPADDAGEKAGLLGAVGRLRRSVERAAASRMTAAGARQEGIAAGVSLRRWASELDRAELDLDRALTRIKRALASARALGDSPDRVRLENAAARAWAAHGYIGRAEEHNARAQVGAARLDDPALVGESLLTGALLREHAGDPLGAASQIERALADYGARMDPWLASEGYVTLGWNLILRGHVRRARSTLLRAGRRSAGAGLRTRPRPPRAGVASVVAACESLLGRSAESRERFELAHERLVDHDVGRTLRALHSLMRALVFVEDGAFTGALELEGALIRSLESAGLAVERTPLLLRPMWLLRARQRLALLEAALDRAGDRARNQEREQLREELDRALDDLEPNARGLPALRCQQRVLTAARLRLDGAREGATSDAFARAVETLGRAQSTAFVIDSPWAQFEVHRERARLLATMGHASAARREAGAALQLAHHQGWAPRARRIRAEFELSDPALQLRGDLGLSASSITGGGGVDGGVASEEVAPAPGQLLRQRSSGGAGALDRCFDALLEVSRTAVARGSKDVSAQARRLLDALVSAMGAERALLFVSEDGSSEGGGGYLRRIAGRDSRGRDLDRDDRYCTTVIEHVVATRAVKVVGGSDDSEFTGSESVEALGLKSIVCAPLLVQERLIGVVYLDNRLVRGLFAPEDRRLLVAMCNHIAIALESSRMNRFMRATRDEALEASRLKSAFLTHMSHELRTPLNAVIGYSEILAEDLATRAPDALPDLARIGDAGKRLLGLISDVLDLAKLESGKLELHRARFEIRPMVDELVASVADDLERNHNDLQVSCPPSIGALYSDRASVLRVLRAVLGNAAKFTHRGVIELDVRWHAKQGGKQLACEIRDSGIGISPDDVGRLFTEFSQADMSTTREYGGAGLGLAISQRLCALLGGSIHVESQRGRGSTFTVVLPDSDPPRAQRVA